MSQVTHKIFSEDVEVGRIEQVSTRCHTVVIYSINRAVELTKYCPKNLYKGELGYEFDFYIVEMAIAFCAGIYHPIPISEVDAYLNLKSTDKQIEEDYSINGNGGTDLLDEIKLDIKLSETDRLLNLFLLIDAELKHRNAVESEYERSGIDYSDDGLDEQWAKHCKQEGN